MTSLPHLRPALGWFLFTLLLTYVPINLIGFASPFVGHLRQPGDPDSALALLRTFQPVAPWLSLRFVPCGWVISRTLDSPVTRTLTRVGASLVPCAYIASDVALQALETPDAADASILLAQGIEGAASVYIAVAGIAFIALAWRAARRLRLPSVASPDEGATTR